MAKSKSVDKKKDGDNSGGTVLKPEGIINAGIRLLKENPLYRTCLHFFVNDLDFTSIYPTIQVVCNISRDTTKFVVKAIKGHIDAVQDLFSNVMDLKGNSVYIGKTYFNLPDYLEMEKEIDELLKKDSAQISPSHIQHN